jgi:septal ring factor EnvC (AmiA/AmiB activator)
MIQANHSKSHFVLTVKVEENSQALTQSLNKRYLLWTQQKNEYYCNNLFRNYLFALKVKQQVCNNYLQVQVDGLTDDLNAVKAQMQVNEQRNQEQKNKFNGLKAQVQVNEQRYQEQQNKLNGLKAQVQVNEQCYQEQQSELKAFKALVQMLIPV